MNVKQLIMEEFERPCCIRGYHVYQEVWTAAVGEELVCEREPHNSHDRYAVAVKRMGIIISHLPRKLLKHCSLFLRRGGSIFSRVSERRRYSHDLLQGGLEIPCTLLFKHCDKPKKLLSKQKQASTDIATTNYSHIMLSYHFSFAKSLILKYWY